MSNHAVTGKIEIPVTGLLLTGPLLVIALFTGCSSSGLLEPDDAAPPEPSRMMPHHPNRSMSATYPMLFPGPNP